MEPTSQPDPVQFDVLAGEIILRSARIEPASWPDPEDLNPNRRTVRMIPGYRRISPLVRMHRANGNITARHIKAANRIAIDFETSDGARAGGQVLDRVSGGGGEGNIITGLMMAAQRFREARDAMGNLATFVVPMVVGGMSLEQIARLNTCRTERATTRLIEGLDRLVGHYEALDGDKKPAPVPIPIISVDERIGRWR